MIGWMMLSLLHASRTRGERITWRLAIGRAIVTAGLAVAAFSVLAFIPDAPKLLIAGVSALAASLGESGIERIIKDRFREK